MEMTIEALLPETKTLYDYLDEDVKLFQKISRRVFDDINSESFFSKYKICHKLNLSFVFHVFL